MICHQDVVDRGPGRGNHGEMLAEQMSAEVNLVCPSIRHALLPPAAAAAVLVCGGESQNITNIQEVLKCIPAILNKQKKKTGGAQNHINT